MRRRMWLGFWFVLSHKMLERKHNFCAVFLSCAEFCLLSKTLISITYNRCQIRVSLTLMAGHHFPQNTFFYPFLLSNKLNTFNLNDAGRILQLMGQNYLCQIHTMARHFKRLNCRIIKRPLSIALKAQL